MLAERAFYCLQQLDSVGFRFFADFLWPDGALYFSDVRLAQEEHTDTGLTDTAADGVRQLFLEDCFLERQLCALGAAGFFQLGQQCLFVHADTHRGQLQGDVQNRIVNKDVGV